MINIRGLYKKHGTHQVLNDLSAEVKKGEVIAITGPSGVGKSTLLRCLNYLEPFDGGTIQIAGLELKPGMDHRDQKKLCRLRASVGMVFQQFNLFPHLTAIQNITLAPRVVDKLPTVQADAKASELLRRVGLGDREHSYPHQLSGGQQQRVAIARALAQEPHVLLFDEPTSALDPQMKKEVWDVIKELKTVGLTMMVVTHEAGFASDVATRVWEMQGGKILKDEMLVSSSPRKRGSRS